MPAGSRQLAGVALAALSGVALATQSRINGQLAAALRDIDPHAGALDGELAGLISTVLGLVLLALFVPAVPFGRRGLRRLGTALRTGRLRWWQCAGGLSGAVLVSTQGVTVTALGVAVFTVAVVAGLVLASLAVDRAGLGPRGRGRCPPGGPSARCWPCPRSPSRWPTGSATRVCCCSPSYRWWPERARPGSRR